MTEDIEKAFNELPIEEKKIVLDEVQRVFGSEKITNIHEFLTKVIQEEDTTKMGYLKDEELGQPRLTLRAYSDLSIMADTFGMPEMAEYFTKFSHATTATSLSRNGFLILAAITERRNLQAKLPSGEKKQNGGWFKRKEPTQQTDMQL